MMFPQNRKNLWQTRSILKKGSKIFVEGSLKTKKWTDKTDQERYTTEIIASNMQMLGNIGGFGKDPDKIKNVDENKFDDIPF